MTPESVDLTPEEREKLALAYERWCADDCDRWDALDSVHDLINILDAHFPPPVLPEPRPSDPAKEE